MYNYSSSVFSYSAVFFRSQDFAREEQLYLGLQTKLTVMSSWATNLCIVCALPWPASSFYSLASWLVFGAAKTHVQLFKMGACCLNVNLCVQGWTSSFSLLFSSVCCTGALLKISVIYKSLHFPDYSHDFKIMKIVKWNTMNNFRQT